MTTPYYDQDHQRPPKRNDSLRINGRWRQLICQKVEGRDDNVLDRTIHSHQLEERGLPVARETISQAHDTICANEFGERSTKGGMHAL